MKRPREDFDPTRWATEDWPRMPIANPVSVPRATGHPGFSVAGLTCEACEESITPEPTSCPHCDAGPFHEFCALSHICPPPPPQLPPGTKGGERKPADNGEESAPSRESPSATRSSEAEEGEGMLAGFKTTSAENVQDMFRFDLTSSPSVDLTGAPQPRGKVEAPLRGPRVKEYARADPAKVAEVEKDKEKFQAALEEFERDKFAQSNQGPAASRLSWWTTRAKQANVEPFPLDAHKLNRAGCLLKLGQYRSAAQYFSAMKRAHLEQGHEWNETLSQVVADAVRSCTRGLGPDKQCPLICGNWRSWRRWSLCQVVPAARGM